MTSPCHTGSQHCDAIHPEVTLLEPLPKPTTWHLDSDFQNWELKLFSLLLPTFWYFVITTEDGLSRLHSLVFPSQCLPLSNYGLSYSCLKFCFLTRLYIPWIQEWSLPVLSYLRPCLIWYKYGTAVRSVYLVMPVVGQRTYRGPCISAPLWCTSSWFWSSWIVVPIMWTADKDQGWTTYTTNSLQRNRLPLGSLRNQAYQPRKSTGREGKAKPRVNKSLTWAGFLPNL